MNVLKRPINNTEIQAKDGSVLMELRKGLLISTALVAIAASVVLTPVDASAQQFWDGSNNTSSDGAPIGGAGTWDAALANWTDNATGTTNQAWASGSGIFGNAGGAVSINGVQAFSDLSFTADGYVLEGAATPFEGLNDIIEPPGSLTINGGLSTINVSTGTATISANIANGTGNGLIKSGAGDLVLSGNNTFTGGITVAGGTLLLAHDNAVGSGSITTTGSTIAYANGVNSAAPIIINSNTTDLQVNGADSAEQSGIISELNGPRPLEKTGTGTLTLSGANTFTGPTTITAGTLNTSNASALGANGEVIIAGAGALDLSADLSIGSVSNDGNIALNNNTLTLIGDGSGNDVFTTLNGVISGSGGVTISDANDFQLFTGANTYTGSTRVEEGTLIISGSLSSQSIAITNTGQLRVLGNAFAAGTDIVLDSSGSFVNVGHNTVDSISSTVGTSIELAQGSFTTGNAGSQTLAGQIIGGGGITKQGTGTLTISGANTNNSGTTILAGTISTANASALSTNKSVNIAGGAILDLAAGLSVGGIYGNGIVTLNGNDLTFTGNGSASVATTTAAGLISGSGGLVIDNANDIQRLTFHNTYTGTTTLSGGTVSINNGNSLGAASGAVSLDGGTLLTANTTILDKANFTTTSGSTSTIAAATGTILSLAGHVNKSGANSVIRFGNASNAGTVVVHSSIQSHSTARVEVNAGTLRIGGSSAGNDFLSFTSGTNIAAGASLDIAGFNTTVRTPTGPGTVTNSGGAATFRLLGGFPGTSNFGGLIEDGAGVTSVTYQDNSILSGINTYTGKSTIEHGTLTASVVGALGATTGDVSISGFGSPILDLGGLTHTKGNVTHSLGTLRNGTFNVDGYTLSGGTINANATVNVDFFGQTGGTQNGTVNTGLALAAIGGSITNLGTGGVTAANASADGISLIGGATAPAINNAAGDGINLSNSGAGGNVDVTLGGNVEGSDDGIDITNTFAGGTVTIDGTGNVTGGNAIGNDGITISALGDVTVGVTGNITGDPAIVISAGAGNILVNGVGSVVGALQAMNLDTTSGNITVSQDATAVPGIQGGTIGIDARSNAGGNITINGIGDITGQANEGVLARTFGGNGVVNISHDGEIEGATVGVTARSGNAGQTGTGTVTVDALQAITGLGGHGVSTRTDTAINTVTGVGTISGTVHGILAVAREGGDVLVTGTGATTTSGANGKAIRADAEDGDGNVTVTRTGVITSSGAGGDGIDADVEGAGNIVITSGVINLTNTASGSVAISADDNGALTSGSITIDSSGGAITVAGAGGDGINARLDIEGDINVTSGVINLTNAGGGSRGVNVVHNGATTGDITVNSTGTIDIAGTAGGAFGIRTDSSNTGNTDIDVSAAITLQDASAGAGIQVENSNVVFDGIDIDTTAAGDINGARRGVRAEATGVANTGNITVTLDGDVGNTDAPSLEAVRTRTVNGINTVTGAGNFTGTTFGVDARSIATLAAGGDITVSGTGATTSTGATSITINARSNAISGDILVNRSGLITNTGAGATNGIFAAALVTGEVSVTAAGGINIAGDGSNAIQALQGGAATENLTVDASGDIVSTGTGNSNGIFALSGTGAVDIDTAAITLSPMSTGTGVLVQAGGGPVSVDTAGALNGGSTGISVGTSLAGTIDITTGAAIGDINAPTSIGVHSLSNDGLATITLGGDVTAGVDGVLARAFGTGSIEVTTASAVTGGTGFGIVTATTTGTSTLTLNAGAVVSSAAGLGISNNAGDSTTTVNTGASVAGEIRLGDGSDVLDFAGGDFSAVTIFDGGDDTLAGDGFIDVLSLGGTGAVVGSNVLNWEQLNIKGTISVTGGTLAAGMTTITNGGSLDANDALALTGNLSIEAGGMLNATGGGSGVYSFSGDVVNSGVISTQDGAAGDVVTIAGNYIGGGSIDIDTVLGGSGSPTDKIVIEGNSSGATVVNVANAGGKGAGTGFGVTDGIQIIEVKGANTGSFTLGGKVSVGAFVYSLSENGFLQTALRAGVTAYSAVQAVLNDQMDSLWQRVSTRGQMVNYDGTQSNTGSGFWMRGEYSDTSATVGNLVAGVTTNNKLDYQRSTVQFGIKNSVSETQDGTLSVGIFGHRKVLDLDVNDMTNSRVAGAHAEGYGGGAAVTWQGANGLYADFVGQITSFDVDATDTLGGSGSFDAVTYSASAEAGYRMNVTESLRFVPQAQVIWQTSDLSDFTDSSGATITWDENPVLSGRVGIAVEFGPQDIAGEANFTGYAMVNLLRDFGNSGSVIASGVPITTSLNDTKIDFRAGIKSKSANGFSNFFAEAGYSQSISGNDYRSFKGVAGISFKF